MKYVWIAKVYYKENGVDDFYFNVYSSKKKAIEAESDSASRATKLNLKSSDFEKVVDNFYRLKINKKLPIDKYDIVLEKVTITRKVLN